MTGTTPCPAWCDGDHPPGDVHRGEICRTDDGKTVTVVILQTRGGGDLSDQLAELIQRGATIRQETDR